MIKGIIFSRAHKGTHEKRQRRKFLNKNVLSVFTKKIIQMKVCTLMISLKNTVTYKIVWISGNRI